MTKNNLLLILLFIGLLSNAQKNKAENRIDKEFPTPIAFPYEFLGKFSGNLNISDNTGSKANIPTEFEIKKGENDKVFEYKFSFIEGQKKITNSYKLHIIDETKGYYAISDDKGMEFMATLIKGVLYSTYDTKDNIMFTSLHFTNSGKLRFNVIVSQKSKQKNNAKVNLSNVVQVQKALLSKI